MEPAHPITFGPFRLDVMHGGLWRGEQVIHLALAHWRCCGISWSTRIAW